LRRGLKGNVSRTNAALLGCCSLFLVEKRTERDSELGGCRPVRDVAVCSSLRRGLKVQLGKCPPAVDAKKVAVCSSLRRGLKE